MADGKPETYEGDYPYVFVSYAHADSEVVLPIIASLVCEGYRVWYDDGIQAGSSFPTYIANRLHDCSCLLAFISKSWVASGWCRNEVGYALDLNKAVLPVYLNGVELPRDLRMRLGDVQALLWHAYTTDEEFNEKLFSVSMLDPCLTASGKRRRGVKPRGTTL